jgi:hypothetical protein
MGRRRRQGAGARLGKLPLPQQPPHPRGPAGPKTSPRSHFQYRLPRGAARRPSRQLTVWASPCPDASPEPMAAGGSTPTLAGDAPQGPTPSSGPLSCGCSRRSSLHPVQKPSLPPPPPRAAARRPATRRLAHVWLLPYPSASLSLIRDGLREGASYGTGAHLRPQPPPWQPPTPRRLRRPSVSQQPHISAAWLGAQGRGCPKK